MKTLLFPLFTLLILASCTVDTVSQDELLQQELLSLSDASKSSNKSGSYEDDDDSNEDENSDNESNESEEGNENESQDENESNEDSENNDQSGSENDTDATDDNDSSNETSENSSSDSSQNTQSFSATVLSNIQAYVNTNHSGQTIIKMEQETSYIDVDLSNGIEIYFDNNGNFMRYENSYSNSSDNDSSDEDSSYDSSSDSSQNTQSFSATVLSNIQAYVNTNHSGQTIVKMEQETSYIEVDLSNGIEIYFDNNGNFMRYENSNSNSSDNDSSDEDSGNDSSSDSSQNTQGFSATVLSNIQTYVNTNHSGQTIIKMEQETNYIEVDLSNGIEIYFDNNGNFMRYDN